MSDNANARRGFVPEDTCFFSDAALSLLRRASSHICYLLEEGYDLKQATTFVGNHFLLSERQRLALIRSVATREQIRCRHEKRKEIADLLGQDVWIDGFNTIITLEVMLSDSPLFLGMDGAIRDLASLRGTYRLIPETRKATGMLFDILSEYEVARVNVLLDAPGLFPDTLHVQFHRIGPALGVSADGDVSIPVAPAKQEQECGQHRYFLHSGRIFAQS